jgi:hypothetical protein
MDATGDNKSGTSFTIIGDWAVQSKELRKKYSRLTDQDLKFEAGKENELLSRIEKKLNKKRDEVISMIRKVQPAKS